MLGQTKWPEKQFKSHTHTCTHSHTQSVCKTFVQLQCSNGSFMFRFRISLEALRAAADFGLWGPSRVGQTTNQPSIKLNRKVSCCISNNSHYAATAAAPAPAARGQRRGVGEGDLEEPFNHAIAPGQIANTYGKCECQVRQQSPPLAGN